jgi:hypothetical protein
MASRRAALLAPFVAIVSIVPVTPAVPIVSLAMLATACAREAAGAGDATQESAAAASAGAAAPAPTSATASPSTPALPPVLAEATNPGIPLVVQVIEAKRVTPDTVRIALAFTSTSTSAEPLSLLAALSGKPGEANPSDFCLLTADGSRRLFLLRDTQNKPVLDGNWQPLKPGERRVVQAMFPAPPTQAGRVTLLLGTLVVRNVPISQ